MPGTNMGQQRSFDGFAERSLRTGVEKDLALEDGKLRANGFNRSGQIGQPHRSFLELRFRLKYKYSDDPPRPPVQEQTEIESERRANYRQFSDPSREACLESRAAPRRGRVRLTGPLRRGDDLPVWNPVPAGVSGHNGPTHDFKLRTSQYSRLYAECKNRNPALRSSAAWPRGRENLSGRHRHRKHNLDQTWSPMGCRLKSGNANPFSTDFANLLAPPALRIKNF